MPISSTFFTTRQGIYFYESGGGTDKILLTAPSAIAAGFTLTLPSSAGSSGQYLQTNGSGAMSWASPSHLVLSNLNGGTYTDGGHTNLAQLTSSTINPTMFNDSTAYKVGSIWTNTVSQQPFICASNALGTAVWRKIIYDGIGNVGIGQVADSNALGVTGATNFNGNIHLNSVFEVLAATGNTTIGGSLTVYSQTPSAAQWGYMTGQNQILSTSSSPSFTQMTLTGSSGNCASQGLWLRWNTNGFGESHFVNHKGSGVGGLYFDETNGTGTVITRMGCITSNRTNRVGIAAYANEYNPALQAAQYSILIGTGAAAALNSLNATVETGRVILGVGAAANSTTCQGCVCVGSYAGRGTAATSGGQNNTWIGTLTGATITTGAGNSTLGYSAGYAVTTGNNNTFAGINSGLAVTTGSSNTFCGNTSGNTCQTGNYNTLVGDSVICAAVSTASAVGLGYNFSVASNGVGIGIAGGGSVAQNNIVIGNSSHEQAVIYAPSGLTPNVQLAKDSTNALQVISLLVRRS
jgi:hypothetical protein